MVVCWGCSKEPGFPSGPPAIFSSTDIKLNGHSVDSSNYNTGVLPVLEFSFSSAIDKSTVNSAFSFTNKSGVTVAYTVSYGNGDKTVIVTPSANLKYLTNYIVSVAIIAINGWRTFERKCECKFDYHH